MNLQRNDRFTLVEALDRLIDKGVSVSGDVSISIADIDLVYLGVRLLLCSPDEVPSLRRPRSNNVEAIDDALAGPALESESMPRPMVPPDQPAVDTRPRRSGRKIDIIDISDQGANPGPPARLLDMDPGQIERDLCRLVLTVVELLRQLMEKQALRRMEGGSLTDAEIERLGLAFERLESKMEELKQVFGLADEELNIDLGPLGTLV